MIMHLKCCTDHFNVNTVPLDMRVSEELNLCWWLIYSRADVQSNEPFLIAI